jgi:hypothetical protein
LIYYFCPWLLCKFFFSILSFNLDFLFFDFSYLVLVFFSLHFPLISFIKFQLFSITSFNQNIYFIIFKNFGLFFVVSSFNYFVKFIFYFNLALQFKILHTFICFFLIWLSFFWSLFYICIFFCDWVIFFISSLSSSYILTLVFIYLYKLGFIIVFIFLCVELSRSHNLTIGLTRAGPCLFLVYNISFF